MTWVRTDDGMPLHPKFLGLSDGAFRLFMNALAFANRATTDGHIPVAIVATLDHRRAWTRRQIGSFTAELVAARLWLERSDGYEIHDYAEYQEEALKVSKEARKVAARERKRAQRAREKAVKPGTSHGVTPRDEGRDTERDRARDAPRDVNVTEAVTRAGMSQPPVPTRPDPTTSPSEKDLPSSPPSAPSPGAPVDPSEAENIPEAIRALEVRYPTGLCAEARGGVALSRRNGKVADSVWLRTLRQLDAYPVAASTHAMRTFVERYADGEKGEAYLVAIARREAAGKGPGARRATVATPGTHELFDATYVPERDDPELAWKETANA